MSSLFRQASKLMKRESQTQAPPLPISTKDSQQDSDSGKKTLFRALSTSKKTLTASSINPTPPPPLPTVSSNIPKRAETPDKEATIANANTALASARRIRSEVALDEGSDPKNSVGENDSAAHPVSAVKKAMLSRSNTSGKKVQKFSTLDAKDPPVPQMSVTSKLKANTLTVGTEAFTGRTSVTGLNKSQPLNFSVISVGSSNHLNGSNGSGNGSVFNIQGEAPPIPVGVLLPAVPTTVVGESKLPQIPQSAAMKSARAATEQPQLTSGVSKTSAQSTFQLASDAKFKQQFQADTAASNQAFLLSSSAAARQEKRQAGLSAYEISQAPTAQAAKRYTLDDFHIVRRVGRGGFAIVFLVRMKASTGRYFALKAIRKAEVVKLKQEKQIVNEKEILKAIKHNFIVELYHTFQDTHYLYMVMEYIDGGDLFSYLRKVQKFGDEDSKFYAAEVLMSLQYLHSENVIFRDLKPENILLDMTGHVKLADFGFAKVVTTTTKSFCGTPDYIAREIVLNRQYTKMVDWWSFGVLIFELVSGKTPFQSDTPDGIYDNIEQCKILWNPLIRGPCKDIIIRLLDKDPLVRLGANGDGNEIRAHVWFKTIKWSKAEVRQLQPPFLPACESPEVIERERSAKGQADDYAAMLKSGAGGGASATDKRPDLSWLTSPDKDPFKNF